ncbi:MAG: type II secretion system F family protein [Verrucomicrobiota bacterium]|jgi:general secretion pathway protein F/type IV pilus assembly protein PilC
MGEFEYTAKSARGETVSGTLDVESEAAVLRVLDEKELFPVLIRSLAGGGQQGQRRLKGRIASRDLGIMYSQLADLLGSGVPLLRALKSLVKSTINPRLREVLKEIQGAVADGKSLTEAMRQHPQVFSPLHIAMIQAGERASFLEQVLRSLAEFLERLDELRSKVSGAMIYPALLTVVGTVVMLGAMIFFVPRFEPLLSAVHQTVPTRLLFAFSHLVRDYWYLLVIGLGGGASLLWSSLNSAGGRRWLERWRFKVPVVGSALRMVAITRFCRILGTMLANGVPLLQALSISKDSTGSPMLAERVALAAENVRAGRPLTEPLAAGGMFPEQIVAMISVAEESNQLEKVLVHIADTVERRTNRQVDQAVRLVEPLILCGVAAAVGFLAMGLLLPIFTMASTLSAK